ncbi:hypothetical protein M885DRAFT_511105 [Pelagophyceae sp. CCMP2097]|nr:hypothetical protein M885DRAFT_511105 [Pelagophyceae sp. CCMP2097]
MPPCMRTRHGGGRRRFGSRGPRTAPPCTSEPWPAGAMSRRSRRRRHRGASPAANDWTCMGSSASCNSASCAGAAPRAAGCGGLGAASASSAGRASSAFAAGGKAAQGSAAGGAETAGSEGGATSSSAGARAWTVTARARAAVCGAAARGGGAASSAWASSARGASSARCASSAWWWWCVALPCASTGARRSLGRTSGSTVCKNRMSSTTQIGNVMKSKITPKVRQISPNCWCSSPLCCGAIGCRRSAGARPD